MTRAEMWLLGENRALFDATGGAILGGAVSAIVGLAEGGISAWEALGFRLCGVLLLMISGVLIIRTGRIVESVNREFRDLWAIELEELSKTASSVKELQVARLRVRSETWTSSILGFRVLAALAFFAILLGLGAFGFAGMKARTRVVAGTTHEAITVTSSVSEPREKEETKKSSGTNVDSAK